jgi:hypothetical protein
MRRLVMSDNERQLLSGSPVRDADGYRRSFHRREVVPTEAREEAKLKARKTVSEKNNVGYCPGCRRTFATWSDIDSLVNNGLCGVCHLWDTRREDPKFRTILSYESPNDDGTPATDVTFAYYEVVQPPSVEEALAEKSPRLAEALVLREEVLRLRKLLASDSSEGRKS